MLAASSPLPGRLGCSRYRSGIREFWQARTSEAGGLTLTSRHAHKSRIRPPSVGSSGPTFRNPRAIDDARARKFAESLELCNAAGRPPGSVRRCGPLTRARIARICGTLASSRTGESQVRRNYKGCLFILLMAVGLGWACGPTAAAVRIEGQVQAGGGPVAKSTVTLWAASANAPRRLAQAQ